MWTVEGDEFKYREMVNIDAPISLVYETIANIEKYSKFLTDVVLAEMQDSDVCCMIVRAGPLRLSARTKVVFEKDRRIDFTMVEGPRLDRLTGSWILEPKGDGATVTFETNIKAGRAGKWLLKTASRYVERKGAALVEAFRQEVLKEWQEKQSAAESLSSGGILVGVIEETMEDSNE